MGTTVISVLSALVALAGTMLSAWWRHQTDEERRTREKREKDEEEDRQAISRRLGALEARVAGHDTADARHETQLQHVTNTLDAIRQDIRDVKIALLGGGLGGVR